MHIFKSLFLGFFSCFKYPLFVLFAFILLFIFMILFWFFVLHFQGFRLQKGTHIHLKKKNILFEILVNAPKRFVLDSYNKKPNFFKYQGCIVYTGRQGNGKTIAMIEQTLRYQQEYPLSKCITNLNYEFENDNLNTWEQLIDYKNGINGVIVCIDEMQNWFSSNQSKNFPPEMLEVITQNRKNRRIIQGTAQSFNRLAKPIREQATEVRRCVTFFGCITVVHCVIPELNSSGDVDKWKHRRFYYFVHTDKIRNSYDTYKVIESLRESGFKDFNKSEINVLNTIVNKKGSV